MVLVSVRSVCFRRYLILIPLLVGCILLSGCAKEPEPAWKKAADSGRILRLGDNQISRFDDAGPIPESVETVPAFQVPPPPPLPASSAENVPQLGEPIEEPDPTTPSVVPTNSPSTIPPIPPPVITHGN